MGLVDGVLIEGCDYSFVGYLYGCLSCFEFFDDCHHGFVLFGECVNLVFQLLHLLLEGADFVSLVFFVVFALASLASGSVGLPIVLADERSTWPCYFGLVFR